MIKAGKIALIIIDSFTNHYRIELRTREIKEVNKIVAEQLTILKDISKNYFIPVLITNQVSNDLSIKGKVKGLGGKFIENFSRCIIELKTEPHRELIVRKNRDEEERCMFFSIKNDGIVKI